jgi:TP901 family phage tail tape measure protein
MAVGVNIVSTFNSKGIARAIADFKTLQGAGAKSTFALRTVDKAATNMAKSLAKVGLGAAVVGGLAVKAFAGFDDALNQSVSIMNGVDDAMRKQMSDAAREMARVTTFSAEEAARSFYFLASAGLDAESAIAALPSVASFAQAGMFDMALATDLLTDAQSALGLSIRDDAVANMINMTKVSDVLVKANTLANASVQQFSEALTNKAGAAMKAVGMDIEEGVAVLAAFADQGIKSTEAGTQFGIVLRDLQTKALANTAEFAKYGVTVFDSSGELRNMADIIGDVEGALEGQSDATKKQILLEMGFSDKSVASMMALIGTSDAIRGYEEELRLASGTTEEIAAKQLTSLSAQLKLARNGFNDMAITIGEKLAPFVRQVAIYMQGLSKVASEAGLGGAIKKLGGDFLNMTANMGAFGNVMLGLISLFVTLRLVAIAATISQNLFNVALFKNPIGIAVAAMIALGVAVVAAYLKFEGFRKVVHAVINVVIQLVEDFVNFFIKGINIVIMAINGFKRVMNFLGADMETIGHIGAVSFGRIGDAAAGAAAAMYSTAQMIRMAEKTAIKPASAETDDFAEMMKKLKEEMGGGVVKAIKTVAEKLKEYVDKLRSSTRAQKAVADAAKGIVKADLAVTEALEAKNKAQARFNKLTQGYGADSKEATTAEQKRAQAQRQLERAGYDLESATFAVADAEADLKKITEDAESTKQDIREAEIALAEARLSLQDITDSQREATDELALSEQILEETINGVKEGTEAHSEALADLKTAEEKVTEATENQTEAFQRQRDALYELEQAQRALNAAKKDTPAPIVARAETIVSGSTPSTAGMQYGSFMEAVRALHPKSKALKSSKPVTESKRTFPALYKQYKAAGLALAQGGIATSPVTALIGEAGKEAIIPLDRLESGMTVNVTINAGMGTDPAKLGDEIVDVLTRYNRRNGALPLKVA